MRIAAAALCALVLVACERRDGIDAALADATRYLASKQSDDGAWRSETYGVMTGGATLTPPVLKTLWMSSPGSDGCARATAYLRGVSPGQSLDYPVYTAAMAAIVFHLSDADRGARDAWLQLLRDHQATGQLGWNPGDPGYGGWGYAVRPPHKPEFGELPFVADLSSTLFAVGALRMSGVGADDPSIRAALVFVERCQNFGDPRHGDGGFFFTPANRAQNKAGGLNSYGSATADGVRALVRCGLPVDHPRVQAAQSWLQRNFTTATNPGIFEDQLAADRDAALYYWSWSVTHAFRLLAVTTVQRDGLAVAWAPMLADALMKGQRPDGSWANPHGFMKEDDPLIATTLAAAALANCREIMASKTHMGRPCGPCRSSGRAPRPCIMAPVPKEDEHDAVHPCVARDVAGVHRSRNRRGIAGIRGDRDPHAAGVSLPAGAVRQ